MRLFQKNYFNSQELSHQKEASELKPFKKKLMILINNQTSFYFYYNDIKNLQKIIEFSITQKALHRALGFKPPRKIALISGAGIAGLAASFELLTRGFNVIVAEKRDSFSRFNVINIDVEAQRFLKKFGLLNEFEQFIAARISMHDTYGYSRKDGLEHLSSSDVSDVQPCNLPFKPQFFNKLFKQDGVYSVRIKDLQNFLARKALESGIHLFGNVEVNILSYTQSSGVSEVQIKGIDSRLTPITIHPHLFFLAEGAHSPSAQQLGMEMKHVKNECTGENWIFGNVAYYGEKTFVFSMIDTSTGKLEIANIIFNALIHEINIAVNVEHQYLSQTLIQERILEVVKQVFSFLRIDELPQSVISAVKKPVHINNEQRAIYSQGNVFCIGDTAGHSSPLAGMGGTLGLTLVPSAVEQLLNDLEQHPQKTHDHFSDFSEAYTSRWIEKSQYVKTKCLGFFNSKQDTPSIERESSLTNGVST